MQGLLGTTADRDLAGAQPGLAPTPDMGQTY
jgi:hypothetical protein